MILPTCGIQKIQTHKDQEQNSGYYELVCGKTGETLLKGPNLQPVGRRSPGNPLPNLWTITLYYIILIKIDKRLDLGFCHHKKEMTVM